jgi:ABC-2 type transport system permease protein
MITVEQEYSLKLKFLKYFEIIKIAYFNNTVYIVDVLGIGGLVAVRIWIFTQLYRTAFGSLGVTQLGGLVLTQTIWILAFTQSFHVSNRTRVIMKAIEYEIKSGSIAYSISKPYSYLLFNFFSCLGITGSNILTTVFFGLLSAVILAGFIKISLIGLLAGIFLLFFGVTLNTLAILIIGLSAFWAEDTSAFRWIYDKMLWIFGGIFLPLSLFPDKFRQIVELLPFNQMFYGPARMIVSFDGHLFYKYFAVQLVWVVIFALVAMRIYRTGLKNLSINAG